MPPVSPTSSTALARGYLAATVAGSSTFQTWVGAANPTAALAFIFFEEAPAGTTTPVAVIESGTLDRKRIAGGSSNWFDGHGTLFLFFRDQVLAGELADQAHVADALTTFENNVDGVMADLWALAGQAGYLDLEDVKPEGPPQRAEYQEAESGAAGAFWAQSFVAGYRSL